MVGSTCTTGMREGPMWPPLLAGHSDSIILISQVLHEMYLCGGLSAVPDSPSSLMDVKEDGPQNEKLDSCGCVRSAAFINVVLAKCQ